MKDYLNFFVTLSAIVGAPVVVGGSIVLLDRAAATVQCELYRSRCSRSFTQGVDYIAEQVSEGVDVVVTPTPRRHK